MGEQHSFIKSFACTKKCGVTTYTVWYFFGKLEWPSLWRWRLRSHKSSLFYAKKAGSLFHRWAWPELQFSLRRVWVSMDLCPSSSMGPFLYKHIRKGEIEWRTRQQTTKKINDFSLSFYRVASFLLLLRCCCQHFLLPFSLPSSSYSNIYRKRRIFSLLSFGDLQASMWWKRMTAKKDSF